VIKKYILLAIFFLVINLLFSQSSRVSKFSINPSERGGKVLINWTMRAGSTCPNLIVERSLDSLNYKEIYIYPAVCGSSDEAIDYSWVDPSPAKFAFNYYRLKLDGIEFTNILSFNNQVELAEKKIFTFPNPTQGVYQVKFRNNGNLKFDVRVYNSSGKLIFEKLKQSGRTFKISLLNLPNDFYSTQILFSDKTTYVSHVQIIN
jgi:hypothetical protein